MVSPTALAALLLITSSPQISDVSTLPTTAALNGRYADSLIFSQPSPVQMTESSKKLWDEISDAISDDVNSNRIESIFTRRGAILRNIPDKSGRRVIGDTKSSPEVRVEIDSVGPHTTLSLTEMSFQRMQEYGTPMPHDKWQDRCIFQGYVEKTLVENHGWRSTGPINMAGRVQESFISKGSIQSRLEVMSDGIGCILSMYFKK